MSNFIARIIAQLDTKDIEQKLNNIINKKHKIQLDIDDSKAETGNKNVNQLSRGFKDAERNASSLSSTIKSLGKANVANAVFRQIEQSAKQAVSAVKEIDKAIVDLQMATGDSYNNIKQLTSGYNDFAKQLGATTTEVTSGASDWLRQGKSIAETNKLIQDSMVLSKVANISSEDSTSYLTATMKGYKKAADEVEGINDSLTSIDLAAAVDAGGLAEATSRVAASADLAGISLNRLLGYEAAVGEASQESMSVIGNSFKTIFSRMSDIKAGKLELVDEDGTTEILSDVETVLNNIGIQLRDSANEFRSFDEVLDDTAKKWTKLSSVQQAAISKAFAGQRQANRFKLLMENYDTALRYEKIANESSGTAMQKFNDGYLNSIEAKQKSLQASFEGLSTNLISRDTISGIMEATQALVEFLDKTNLLKGALAGFATGGILKGFVALTTSITQASMKMQEFGRVLNFSKKKDMGIEDVQKLSMLVDGFSKNQIKAVISSKQLSDSQKIFIQNASSMTEAQKDTILNAMKVSEEQAMATLSTMGLATAQGTATASTNSLGLAFKGLWNTLKANPIVWISTALTAGVAVWEYFKRNEQESIQRATDAVTAYKESSNALQEQINKYKELKSQLDSGTLTPSEEYETRQQILDIQTQISDQYGQQAANIDLVNGSLQTQLSLLQQISSENAKQALNENREEYKNAAEQMTTERSYLLGSIEIADKGKLNKEIQDIVSSFEESGLSLTEVGGGEKYFNILFKGDATQAEESINDFMNKITELKDKYTDEDSINLLDSILDQAGKSYSENKDEVLSKNEDNYKKFLQMDMLSKGTGQGSVADIFNQYTEAVENYNEALSSGDKNATNKARSDFASISDEVDTLLAKGDNASFQTLFDDITDQLNTAAIKSMEFQEALSGTVSNKNQFHDFSDSIKYASEGLKLLKLDAVDVMDALVTTGYQTGESKIQTLAKAWGLSAESSKDDIQAFIDVLTQAGLVSGEVGTSVESASQSFESLSSTIEKTVSNYETLKTIMSESLSGAGISAENVSAFKEMFGDDAEKALEQTENGYHLNRKALDELQAQMGEMTKTDFLSSLSDQYTELQDIEAQIATAELFNRDTSGLEASRNGILENISSLQDLQVQYEAATSAYQQWLSAMSGGEEGDMYDSVQKEIEKANELYDKGLTGTNEFREFTDLMSNKDLSTATNEEIVAAYEQALPMIERYFTEGQNGVQNFLEDLQNFNSEWAHMNEDGSWDIQFDDQEVADKLGIDVEAVQAIMKKLSDYGFDIELDKPSKSMEQLKTDAESANNTLSKLGDEVQIDLNADSFEKVDHQISNVQDYIEEVEGSDLDLDVKTDKLNAANTILEYLVTRKQELGQKENVDVAINISEEQLQAGYNTLNQLKNDLQNLQGKVGVDTVGLQTDINNCMAQIEAMSPEMKVALGIQGMTMDEIKAGLLDGSIQLPITADTEKANSAIEKIKNNKIEDKNFNVNANTSKAENSLSTIRNYLSAITSKDITVTVNKVAQNKSTHSTGKGGSSADGSVSVNGTAHVRGTAYANGSWGNPTPGKKLVGELGTEIVVNPHTGRWYTVGDNGAEFVEIPRNAIVFNHLQSENLLKKGYTAGRGALSGGTALASGTALSGGSGKLNVGNSGSSSGSSTGLSNHNNGKSDDKTKKNSKQTFDWIARKLERLQQMIDLTKVKFENLFAVKSKSSNLDQQIKQTNALLKANKKAAEAYEKYASKVDLSASLKKKVQNGNYSIKDYGEKTAEKINKYKDYYDRKKESEKQVHELTTAVRELKAQKYQLYVDRAENQIERYDAAIDAGTNYKNNNKYVNTQIAQTKESYKYQIKIARLTNDTVKVKQLEAEKEQAIIELQKKKFDNIQTYYENQIALLQDKENAIQDQVDLLEAKGMTISAKYYTDQINSEKQKRTQLQKSKKELEAQLKNVKKGTEEWYDCKSAIADVSSELSDCNKSIAEMNSSITELADHFHEKMKDAGDTVMETLDWAVSLMDNVDLFDSDTGDITKEGLATLGSYVSNYHTSSGMADRDEKLIKDLEKNYKKKNLSFIDSNGYQRNYNSLEEFKASIDETYEAWREQISTTYDYESKIIDMMRDKLKNELSALQELIDAKKEALRAEKDLHDYQRNLQEKTKDISTIQKQIAAYRGDTSQEGLAKLQQLQVQLSEKQDDLRETEYDKYISDQEEMLDRLYEEYDKSVTSELQNVEKLLQDGIEIAQAASDNIAEILEQYTGKYDYEGKHDKLDTGINNITNSSDAITGFLLKQDANEGVTGVKSPLEAALESSTVKTVSPATKDTAVSAKVTTPAKKANQTAAKKETDKKQEKETIQSAVQGTFESGKNIESTIDSLAALRTSRLESLIGLGGSMIPDSAGDVIAIPDLDKYMFPNLGFSSINEALEQKAKNSIMNEMPAPIPVNNVTSTNGDTIINIEMNNVENPEEFIRKLQTNEKLQRAVQACTTSRSDNNRRFGVNEIK